MYEGLACPVVVPVAVYSCLGHLTGQMEWILGLELLVFPVPSRKKRSKDASHRVCMLSGALGRQIGCAIADTQLPINIIWYYYHKQQYSSSNSYSNN